MLARSAGLGTQAAEDVVRSIVSQPDAVLFDEVLRIAADALQEQEDGHTAHTTDEEWQTDDSQSDSDSEEESDEKEVEGATQKKEVERCPMCNAPLQLTFKQVRSTDEGMDAFLVCTRKSCKYQRRED